MFANPYYNDSEDISKEPLKTMEDQIDHLSSKLKETCKETKQREAYFEKVQMSFMNVRMRWRRVHESGYLQIPQVSQSVRIMDRHAGHFVN